MQRTAQRLSEAGWRVFRMDLRAAGAGIRFARRFYNAACSTDVATVVNQLGLAFPGAPLAVVGFSLGGNIVLKYAGELGDRPPPGLRAIAVVAAPIDLERCSALMARQPFYDAFYVRHLTQQVALHEECFPDVPKIVFPRRLVLREFDDLYTAPRWGYASALDYYRRASAFPWIDSIQVPTFLLTARDDPFVAVEPFDALQKREPVEVHISAHGGHMGFLGADGNGGIRWAESRIVDWLINRVR
jgi:predicted alpha/beta-fold hydrolase